MKPVPATVAALTVTAAVPVEDRVNVCVVAVFALTLPKDKLDELTLSVGTDAPSCQREGLWPHCLRWRSGSRSARC